MLSFNCIIPLTTTQPSPVCSHPVLSRLGSQNVQILWIHRFCSNIILYFLMFLKIFHNNYRGCLTIHQVKEPILIMPPFGDFKVFPIWATINNKLSFKMKTPWHTSTFYKPLYSKVLRKGWLLTAVSLPQNSLLPKSLHLQPWEVSSPSGSPIYVDKEQLRYLLQWPLGFPPAPGLPFVRAQPVVMGQKLKWCLWVNGSMTSVRPTSGRELQSKLPTATLVIGGLGKMLKRISSLWPRPAMYREIAPKVFYTTWCFVKIACASKDIAMESVKILSKLSSCGVHHSSCQSQVKATNDPLQTRRCKITHPVVKTWCASWGIRRTTKCKPIPFIKAQRAWTI